MEKIKKFAMAGLVAVAAVALMKRFAPGISAKIGL